MYAHNGLWGEGGEGGIRGGRIRRMAHVLIWQIALRTHLANFSYCGESFHPRETTEWLGLCD
jgi:hypothetical protein